MLSTGKCPHCDLDLTVEVEVVADTVELEAVGEIVEPKAVTEQDAPKRRRTRRRWYYSLDGKQGQGPVSADELRALIANSVVKREHFLSNDGKLWSRAHKLKGVNWP